MMSGRLTSIWVDLAKIYTSTYVVQPGDTLLKISMKFKVRKQELANVNNVFGETVFLNQVRILQYLPTSWLL